MAKYPNILWIQTDEQRPDSLGCYGSAWAKTPNLDLLAERGVVMRNCVCQSPVCAPSRASQLTCVYPQECNVLLNEVADGGEVLDEGVAGVFPEGTVTFPEVFARAGYQTASFGKSHIPKHPTWQHIERTRLNLQYAYYNWLGPNYEFDLEKYRVLRCSPNGVFFGGTYPVFLGNPSMKNTDDALEFLRERDPDRPFLVRVSHNWPHTPVLTPPPFDRLYRADEIPILPFDRKAAEGRSQYDLGCSSIACVASWPDAAYRQAWTDYMGLVGYVDYEVGRLLAGLKALGLEDSTLTVFSSDHGRGLGELGKLAKHCFDDPIWRVPFIWHWPGHIPRGEVRDDLCELVDTGRTLLSLAGLADRTPPFWRGRDLFGSAAPPDAVFGQIGWPNTKAPLMDYKHVRERHDYLSKYAGGTPWYDTHVAYRTMRMGVRTARYRMDVSWMRDGKRLTGEELDGNLIDLQEDPQEKNNLWKDPAHRAVSSMLMEKLDRWFDQMDKPATVFGDLAGTAPGPMAVLSGAGDGA